MPWLGGFTQVHTHSVYVYTKVIPCAVLCCVLWEKYATAGHKIRLHDFLTRKQEACITFQCLFVLQTTFKLKVRINLTLLYCFPPFVTFTLHEVFLNGVLAFTPPSSPLCLSFCMQSTHTHFAN